MLAVVRVFLIIAGLGFAASLAGLMFTGRAHAQSVGSLATHKRWQVYLLLAVFLVGCCATAFVALHGLGRPSAMLRLHDVLIMGFLASWLLSAVFNGRRFPKTHLWFVYPCFLIGEALAATGIYLAVNP